MERSCIWLKGLKALLLKKLSLIRLSNDRASHMPSLKLSPSALIAFRVFFGFCLTYDLVVHFADVPLFYTDQGFLPRLAATPISGGAWSLYQWSGAAPPVFLLYIAQIILSLLFMGGIAFPLVPFLLWVFQISLRNRNYAITDGSDDLSVILLFFSIFLPLSRSLTTRFQKWWYEVNDQPLWHFTFVVQILLIYFFTGILKSDLVWQKSYHATFLALRLDTVTNSFGHYLLHYPLLLKVVTASVIHLEVWGSVLFYFLYLFPSKKTNYARQILCTIFIFFHLGLSATMRLGVFPYYSIALWLAVFPWDIQKPLPKTARISLKQTPSALFALLTLFGILSWNALQVNPHLKIPNFLTHLTRTLSLKQSWGMFAPYPALDNYRVEAIGRLNNGTEINLYPESYWAQNRHRTKYWLNMDLKREDYLKPFASYLCAKEPVLTEVEIISHHRLVNRDTFKEQQYTDRLWKQNCR